MKDQQLAVRPPPQPRNDVVAKRASQAETMAKRASQAETTVTLPISKIQIVHDTLERAIVVCDQMINIGITLQRSAESEKKVLQASNQALAAIIMTHATA